MKKRTETIYYILILLPFIIVSCSISDKKITEQYPVIDLVGSVKKYQMAYCSDYFSSIELIPLETKAECLLPVVPFPRIRCKDGFFFMSGESLYAFDSSGKFLNPIGKKGQGPGEYILPSNFFLNTDRPVVYVADLKKILEYDFDGNHIRSIDKPEFDNNLLTNISYVGDDLFIGDVYNDGEIKYKYYLFNRDGEIINCFPNHIFFNKEKEVTGTRALEAIRIDHQLYLKDYINDTLYVLNDSKLQPAYVFGLGKYSYPMEYLENFNMDNPFPLNSFRFGSGLGIVGTPKFFFYKIIVPKSLPKPKAKLRNNSLLGELKPDESSVYGIYDIEKKKNILLDTDKHLQKGFVNDLNGGLPIIPRYYAGDNIVVDVWNAEDMKEILTEEYFASQEIKDPQAHQKLKEVLKNLREEDNPVVVVVKLK